MQSRVVDRLIRNQADDVFGVFCAVAHPAPSHLSELYRGFTETVARNWSMYNLSEGKDYIVYAPHMLHSTISTFHPFWNDRPADESAIASAWHAAATRAMRDPEWPTAPCSLLVERARLDAKAGILQLSDEDGSIQRMRVCLARQVDNELNERLQRHGASTDGFFSPKICHMTVMRWGISNALDDVELATLRTGFEDAWPSSEPIRIRASSLHMIREHLPYMARFTSTTISA